jgi:DNA-binding transcriptional LysR family regulator
MAERTTVSFAELRDRQIILPTNLRRFPDYLATALAQHGFRLRARVESASYALIKELVRADVAIAVVPQIVCDGALPWARIVDPRITRQVGWLERDRASDMQSRNAFKALLIESCREFVGPANGWHGSEAEPTLTVGTVTIGPHA